MPDTSQDREQTNSRITYAATVEGIERANVALRRRGIGSKASFAELCDLSRSTITKFFGGKPIQQDCFETIFKELELPGNWKEIADIEIFENNKKVEAELNYCHQIIDDNNDIPFSFAGSVQKKDIPKLKNILKLIRELANDDCIEAIDIEQGSIKLILKGSPAGLQRLEQLFQSGELNQILEQELNITVENVSFTNYQNYGEDRQNQTSTTEKTQLAFTIAGDVSQADIDILKAALINTSDDEKIKNEEKFRLIEEIKRRGAEGRNLIGANLSGADLIRGYLSRADLRDANLSGANLSNSDLRAANLSNSDLGGANLSGADLIRADLRGANLRGTNLSDTNFSGANLRGANLSYSDLRVASLIRANLSDTNFNGADLRGANLSYSDLRVASFSDAKVNSTRFGSNFGISPSIKQNLVTRGAIFEDSPGDRIGVLTPV